MNKEKIKKKTWVSIYFNGIKSNLNNELQIIKNIAAFENISIEFIPFSKENSDEYLKDCLKAHQITKGRQNPKYLWYGVFNQDKSTFSTYKEFFKLINDKGLLLC